jgi:hypothetical protein
MAPMLKTASLHAMLIALSKTLSRSGLGDVQILDRRSSRQKSRLKGHEILCETMVGNYPIKIAVKVIQDQIRTRMVDELAGTVLRTNSDLGILVSPFNRSRSIAALQGQHRPVRIEILDGDRLAELMRWSGVGVRSKGGVDYAYFTALEELASRIEVFLGMEAA